ncbi:MAG: hypothetical protein GY943_10170 [Chloroflexi bacterium]|nr:hypothetical protein [Chloroflexota bacterium]
MSQREFDVLECVAKGAANKQIALELHISPNTVKVHLRNIYTKLGATSRTEATHIAMEQGQLKLPGQEPQPDTLSLNEVTSVASSEVVVKEGEAMAETAVSATSPAQRDTPSQSELGSRKRIIAIAVLTVVTIVIVALIGWQTLKPLPQTPPFTPIELGDNWHTSPHVPIPTSGMATVANGLNIYLIGGETEAGVVDTVNIYHTVSQVWQTGDRKPTAVTAVTAAILFGEIYVPGGRLANGNPTNIVEAYSPTNDAWRTIANLPEPISGGLTLTDGSFLYVFGGQNKETYLNTAYIYDVDADNWRPLPEMGHNRAAIAGTIIAGKFYVVGGNDKNGVSTACEFFDATTTSWHECPDMLQARSNASGASLVNRLYVFGGTSGGVETRSLSEVFDPQTGSWSIVNTPISELAQNGWSHLGAVQVETHIYVLGGQQHNKTMRADAFTYAPLSYRTYLPSTSSGGGN